MVIVETNKGSFKAKKVILATGAWTNELLNSTGLGLDLPLKVSYNKYCVLCNKIKATINIEVFVFMFLQLKLLVSAIIYCIRLSKYKLYCVFFILSIDLQG